MIIYDNYLSTFELSMLISVIGCSGLDLAGQTGSRIDGFREFWTAHAASNWSDWFLVVR